MGEHHEFLRRARHPEERVHLTDRDLLLGIILLLGVHMEASTSQYDELKAAVDGLVTSVTDAQSRVTAHIDSINQHIADLEAQIAAGQAPDLTALKAEVEGAKAAVDAIDPTAGLPAPAPEPAPPVAGAGEAPAGDPPPDAPPSDPASA